MGGAAGLSCPAGGVTYWPRLGHGGAPPTPGAPSLNTSFYAGGYLRLMAAAEGINNRAASRARRGCALSSKGCADIPRRRLYWLRCYPFIITNDDIFSLVVCRNIFIHAFRARTPCWCAYVCLINIKTSIGVLMPLLYWRHQ